MILCLTILRTSSKSVYETEDGVTCLVDVPNQSKNFLFFADQVIKFALIGDGAFGFHDLMLGSLDATILDCRSCRLFAFLFSYFTFAMLTPLSKITAIIIQTKIFQQNSSLGKAISTACYEKNPQRRYWFGKSRGISHRLWTWQAGSV